MTRPICLGKQNPDCTAAWHGTYSAYQTARCRCPHAREARRLNDKRRRQGRSVPRYIDGLGVARMLQAVYAIGWDWISLGQHLNCSHQAVEQWATRARPRVHIDTHAKVKAVYRDLVGRPGPSQDARDRAAAKGWLTPIYWDNVDDPNEKPATPCLTADELAEVRRENHERRLTQFIELRSAGWGRWPIRRQLNINNTIYNQLLDRHLAETTRQVAA